MRNMTNLEKEFDEFDSFSDAISKQIMTHKYKLQFTDYIDAIIDFLNLDVVKKQYDFITYDNIKRYLNRPLREKLLEDFKKRNMLDKKHFKKHKALF